MRLGMKIELERDVMNAIYKQRVIQRRRYLRMSEIAKASGVSKASLQRILPRLVKRGWIKKEVAESWSGKEPEERKYHLEYLGGMTMDTIRHRRFHIREISKEYREGIENLPDFLNKTERMHPKERMKILRKGKVRGRVPSLQKTIKNHIAKEYTFYKIVQYPFIFRMSTHSSPKPEKENSGWTYVGGTKRFWKKSGKELWKELKLIKREKGTSMFPSMY